MTRSATPGRTAPRAATPRYTEQQARALATRDKSVALEAGAGCGKTFVLTERFLSHLDPATQPDPPAVDALVAITFTDAAAREMRDRIRSKCLARLATADEKASGYWLRLLRSLDAARISTIHAFCGAVLRRHAVALGIDPAFAVLDQAAADVMLSEAVDAHLRAGLERQEEGLLALAAEYEIRGLKQRLGAMLGGEADRYAAWLDRGPKEVVEAWRAIFQAAVAEPQLDAVRNDPAWGELLALLDRVRDPTAKFAEQRATLRDLAPALREGAVGAEAFPRLRDALGLRSAVARCWDDPEDHARYKQVAVGLREGFAKPPRLADGATLHRAADLGLAVLREAVGVAEAYAAAKRAAGALDYDDLLRGAHHLLTDPGHAAVQAELRREVRLLLVDEFQDTDHRQSDIVRALVGEGPAGEGRLFFVGDFKQSIYRFRGAEPGVFRDLQDAMHPDGRLPLSTNFRSQPAVLEFVNGLFAPAFGESYTPLDASRPQTTDPAAVELLTTIAPGEKPKADQLRKAEARAIARRLRGLFDSEAPIVAEDAPDGGRRPRAVIPGDVALLFQSLSDVQHYEQALRDERIEYYLVGGHAFYSQQEVYDVLHLLRSVASGCDDVSLAGVLRSPMFALEDETLYWMARASNTLNAALAARRPPPQLAPAEAAKLARARDTLLRLRSLKGRVATVDLLREAIDRTGYDAALLAEFLGERKRANLEKLLEQARASDAAAGSGDLDRFIRQLSEFTLRQPKEALASTSSEGAGVVRLMTVHRAKGLEFPVVVLPDLARGSHSDQRSAAFDPRLGPLVRPASGVDDADGMVGLDVLKRLDAEEDRAESLRKFYVACTRAADYLLLSASAAAPADADEPPPAKGEWLTLLAERYDLATGQPLDTAAGAPPIRLTRGDGSEGAATPPRKRVDRLRLIDEARAARGSASVASPMIEPVAVRPESLRRFSVSRLTGRLHHGRERPEAVALQAALRSDRDKIEPRGLGTLVHAVLERLPPGLRPTGAELADLCRELAPQHVRRRIDDAASQAAEMIGRFVATPPWTTLAAAERVEREVEFVLAWPPVERPPVERPPVEQPAVEQPSGGPPDAWLRGFIDCLHRDPDGRWRVVDFKTNQTDAEGVSRLMEEYRLQLGVYALAVERGRGEAPAGLRLCFLRPGVVVDLPWDAAARDETLRRVSEAIQHARDDATP